MCAAFYTHTYVFVLKKKTEEEEEEQYVLWRYTAEARISAPRTASSPRTHKLDKHEQRQVTPQPLTMQRLRRTVARTHARATTHTQVVCLLKINNNNWI